MFCRKCGHEFEGEFCTGCGAPVQNSIQKEKKEPSPVLTDIVEGVGGIFKTIKIIAVTLLIAGTIVLLLEASGNDFKLIDLPFISVEKYTDMVKNGTRDGYEDITYNEAFNSFFISPKWEYFLSEDNQRIVEFTGKCTYSEKQIDVLMQFTLDENLEYFELSCLEFNEIPQNLFMQSTMIDIIFDDYTENI